MLTLPKFNLNLPLRIVEIIFVKIDRGNNQLIQFIQGRIVSSPQQRITFAEYMELVLYHPQFGYYASNSDRIGDRGDFFTSPHLGRDFGELLAVQLHQIWQILGSFPSFQIVEMGAGQGILAADILSYMQQEYPDLFTAIDYIIIEAAPAMITAQQAKLSSFPVRWCQWSEINDNAIVGCFISNELIDAFPVHQIVVHDRQLQEVYLQWDSVAENFIEILGSLSTPRLADYWQLNGVKILDDRYLDGYRTEVNLAALDWLTTVSKKLQQGYIISIDYGYTADRYYNTQRSQGTLQCYYRHRHHHDPYINIGYQDLTTHVDFTALEKQGQLIGLNTVGFIQQAMWLMALGLGDRIAAISHQTGNIQSLLQRRQNLHQLIDPTGLGKFGVLVQSKGLTSKQQEILLLGLTVPSMF
jgi:SAM-dependent MidA family methyltransferase